MKYLFLLMLLFSDLITITYLQKDRSFAKSAACDNPIARVVNTNHPMYRFGTPICEQTLKVNGIEPLKVVCSHSLKIVVVKESKDLSVCPKSSQDMSPAPENDVVRGNFKSAPILLKPYGLTLRETQVVLGWQPVDNALYEVTIDDGHGDYRSFNTKNPFLLVNKLKPGESYQVVIYTSKSQKSTNVFRVLSNNKNKELSALLKMLDSQAAEMAINDYVHLKLAFLNQYDLANESILFVTSQHKKYPNNSLVNRSLGDLYVKVSRPDLALTYYQNYLNISQHNNIDIDIADAQKRIQLILAQLKQ